MRCVGARRPRSSRVEKAVIVALVAMLALLLGLVVAAVCVGCVIYSKLHDIFTEVRHLHAAAESLHPGVGRRSAAVRLPEPDSPGHQLPPWSTRPGLRRPRNW